MHSAMILAAGLGSRLLPLTDELPKALMPLGDRPLMARLAARLHAAGYLSAAINTHHRAADFRSVFQQLPLHIEESFEPEILGTAGGIAKLRSQLRAPVLVHNADIDCELELSELTARTAGGGICLAVAPRSLGQGVVGVDDQGLIVRLRGEVFGNEAHGGDYIGVLSIGADGLEELPRRGCLIGDYCLPRLRQGQQVGALCRAVQWNDIGTLNAYVEGNFAWLAHWQAQGAGRDSYLGEGASIDANVTVHGSLIGSGASVAGRGRLERCIVWPGAQAKAPLSHAIVTRAGRVLHWGEP